jgi:adenosylcobinamide-phosphate synthase
LIYAFIIIAAFLLDAVFGDPHGLPHPVVLIGKFIAKGEAFMRRYFSPRTGGTLLALGTIAISFCIPFFLLFFLARLNFYAALALEIFFCYQILAAKSLKKESMRVYRYLEANDIANSRKYLSWIVGRDTKELDQKQIIKATVETVAENTSDGVIAPLFYMAAGGAPLGFLYKAVNTLDSMIGYKNEAYIEFGRFAAKMDDVFNFIPAWLSGLFMIAGSLFVRLDTKNAVRIFRRDRNNHASPNSAKTESVAAGALGIQLAGDAFYFGKLYRKKTIGDVVREPHPDDICKMNTLMYATAVIGVLAFAAVRIWIWWIVSK